VLLRRPGVRAIAVVFTLLWGGGFVQAQDYPTFEDVYINDFAGILDDGRETRLRDDLIRLYDRTGVEMVVVTMSTMRAYGHAGEIEPFATGLFNHWGIGNANLDNGVLLLVAKDDRQMRIELGDGYDRAMDARMQRIIDRDILPEFRKGNFGLGIEDGVGAVISILDSGAGVSGPLRFFDQARDGARNLFDQVGNWVYALMAGAAALAFRLYRALVRRRARYCPVDGSRMTLLDEVWDDHQLQKGQITEERLGSVDYDVWDCPACNHVTVEGYRAWFSRYGACRACGFRTVEGTTTILESATTTSTGRKRVDYHCHNCEDRYSVEHTIPRRSQSQSSGSGSSRSSFGGGRSSGGGASGRW
jgi:uncharacterized protein